MILMLVLFGACMTDALYYAFLGQTCIGKFHGEKPRLPFKHCIGALVGLFFIYAPLCTQGFFFHDDYLNFTGVYKDFYTYSISQGREITGLLTDIFSGITASNSYILRWVAVGGLGIFLLILMQTMYRFTASKAVSMAVSLITVLLVPIVNVVAYGSMFCYSFSFAFSAMGIVHFTEALKSELRKNKCIHILVGTGNIIAANLIYQATAAIAFPFILICWLFDRPCVKQKLYFLYSTLFFIASTGIYYILMKLIAVTEEVPVMGRGEVVSSFDGIASKAVYFGMVLVEGIKQITASFLGNSLFTSPWMHSILEYRSGIWGAVTVGFCVIFIIAGFVSLYRKHKLSGLIQVALCLPLSYYVFLLLGESAYTAYYAGPLCICMLIVMYLGGISIFQFVKRKVFSKCNSRYVLFLLLFMIAWNSNDYMRDFWVGYNQYGYRYLKQAVAAYKGEERIHLYGSLFPGQADIYTEMAARMACKELNIPADNITFTVSSNRDYIETLSFETYEEMVPLIGEEEIELLNKMYVEDTNFRLYTVRRELLSSENIDKLRSVFVKAGIMPDANSQEILVVDLQEVTSAYYWLD